MLYQSLKQMRTSACCMTPKADSVFTQSEMTRLRYFCLVTLNFSILSYPQLHYSLWIHCVKFMFYIKSTWCWSYIISTWCWSLCFSEASIFGLCSPLNLAFATWFQPSGYDSHVFLLYDGSSSFAKFAQCSLGKRVSHTWTPTTVALSATQTLSSGLMTPLSWIWRRTRLLISSNLMLGM